jgi:hypothetical protein
LAPFTSRCSRKPNSAKYVLKAIRRKPLLHKGFEPLHPEDIADIIHFVVSRPLYHVNIADLLVLPTAQAVATILKEIFKIDFRLLDL